MKGPRCARREEKRFRLVSPWENGVKRETKVVQRAVIAVGAEEEEEKGLT